jgi:D-inositol-3-phosphate glycosyltransferase
MQRYYGAPAHKIEIIPCGVDLERFRPLDRAAARSMLGLSGERIILFVGRIEPLKGVDILLRAFAMLEDQSSVRLAIVGGDGGKDKEVGKLRALARELGVGQRVTFLGSLDHSLLPQVYAAADVCVVPSYYESFGLVALEAMACGRPVIASRVGGLQSTVRDGETGFLIPWHCPEPFAEHLELLLRNERLREQFGRAARQAVERFSWRAISQSLVAVYEDLLGEKVAAHSAAGCCCGPASGWGKQRHVHAAGRGTAACCIV